MKELNYSQTWYHGSPFKLKTLRKGSTITQDRNLARIFSHKPTIVSISDDGTIKHNGKISGFLYRIVENIKSDDICPHPRSSIDKGKKWLTNRELRVELISPTEIANEERLTEEEILILEKTAKKDKSRKGQTSLH